MGQATQGRTVRFLGKSKQLTLSQFPDNVFVYITIIQVPEEENLTKDDLELVKEALKIKKVAGAPQPESI